MSADETHDAESLASIANALVEEALRSGASDAVVSVGTGTGSAVELRQGVVRSRGRQADCSVSLTVYRGLRQGSAQSTDLSPERRSRLVRAALDIATHTAEDPFAGPAEAEILSRSEAELDLHHPWALSTDEAIALAHRLEAGTRSVDLRAASDGAWVSTYEEQSVLATSRGFCRASAQSMHALSSMAIAQDRDRRQRDFCSGRARAAADLAAPEAIGAEAAERASAALAVQPLATCSAPVLFDPRSATTLLGHLVQAASGRTLTLGASFLRDALDRPLFPEALEVVEDPWQPRGLASALFDSEGVGARPRHVVEDGRLRGWFLSTSTARQLGVAPTGHASGAYNLRLYGRGGLAGGSFADMLRRLDTGLLVTGLTGEGVRLVDGDYSRAAQGFWVAGGQIRHAVERITLAGNLREIYAGIRAVGDDTRTEGAISSGSVLVDRLRIGGGG